MAWSWTQPCCFGCYEAIAPGREPVRLRDAKVERCVWCGDDTKEGIYIRVDPREAVYPTKLKET